MIRIFFVSPAIKSYGDRAEGLKETTIAGKQILYYVAPVKDTGETVWPSRDFMRLVKMYCVGFIEVPDEVSFGKREEGV